ncbi:MAG: hypothetical protein ACK5RG_09595 [Cyclobacteriaceae bacterium]|jgi:hypothetical protein|nr:hypothetical protein [Flammeovirgaceae bacterium]
MKRLLTTILICVSLIGVSAQDNPTEKQDPKTLEVINRTRIALISEKLKLTPEQAEKFWPIYREFTEHRMELRKQLREAERTQDPAKPKPERDQELIKLALQLKQQNVDLEKNYSERLLKVISAQQLLTLPKAEEEFRRMLLQRLQEREDLREMRRENRENLRQKLEQRTREKNN